MVMVRMGSMPIPSIKWSVSIDTMTNLIEMVMVTGTETALRMGILPIHFASLSLRVQCEWALWCIHTCDLLGVNYCVYNSRNYGLHCSVWGHSHLRFSQLLHEP